MISLAKAKLKPSQNWILSDSNVALRTKCQTISWPLNTKQQETIAKMTSYIDACYEHKDKQFQINSGIAVAANQMGLCDQIIYVHFNQDGLEHKYLIANPKIIAESMQKCVISQGEGCLSVPCDQKGYVKRANKIIVKAFDLLNEFKPIQITAEGILAVCLQHEIDHLQGMLYYDRIDSKNPYYLQPDWIKY